MRSVISFVLIATIGLAGLAVIAWERAELKQIERRRSEMAIRRAVLERAVAAQTQHQKRGNKLIQPDGTAEGGPKKPSAEFNSSWQLSDKRTIIAKNPEIRALYLKGLAIDLQGGWGPLLKQLGLSQATVDRFNAIKLQTEEKKLNNVDVAQAYREEDRALRALLGKTDFAAYQDYSRQDSARGLVRDLPGFAPDGSTPLTPSQNQDLTQILADTSRHDQYGYVVYGTVDWSQAMPRAQAILAPNQYQALQNMEAEKISQWKAAQLINSHSAK